MHVFMNDNQVRIYPLVDLLFLYTMILSFNIDHVLLPPDYTYVCLFCEIRIYAGNTHAHIPLSFVLKSIVQFLLPLPALSDFSKFKHLDLRLIKTSVLQTYYLDHKSILCTIFSRQHMPFDFYQTSCLFSISDCTYEVLALVHDQHNSCEYDKFMT